MIFETSRVYNLSRIYNIASHKNKTETRKHFFCCRGLKNRFFHDSIIMNICSCTAISNVKGSSNFDIYLDRQFRPTWIPVKHWTQKHKRITTTPESESDKSTCDFLNSIASIFFDILPLSQAPPQVLATTRWPGVSRAHCCALFLCCLEMEI